MERKKKSEREKNTKKQCNAMEGEKRIRRRKEKKKIGRKQLVRQVKRQKKEIEGPTLPTSKFEQKNDTIGKTNKRTNNAERSRQLSAMKTQLKKKLLMKKE